jgi:hypothetical protein
MAESGDSVVQRFTAITSADGSGKWVAEGSKDTVAYNVMVSGDSAIHTSQSYVDQQMPGKPRVMWKAVGRMSGDKLVGTSMVMLADKPDSVVNRARWEATRGQ